MRPDAAIRLISSAASAYANHRATSHARESIFFDRALQILAHESEIVFENGILVAYLPATALDRRDIP
jgi:hypothetical protein